MHVNLMLCCMGTSNCYTFPMSFAMNTLVLAMTIESVRRENLSRLVAVYESQLMFATQAGLSGQYLSQLLMGRRNIGEKTARKIEASLNLDSGALDREAIMENKAPKSIQDLPLEQVMLLSDYQHLSPKHRDVVRELVAIYARFDQDQGQQQQQQQQQ